MIFLWIPVAIFVVVILLLGFIRVRQRRAEYGRTLEDDHIRQIEEVGWVVLDSDPEPLDLEHIEEAEEQFWTEETWDEGEEW